MKITYNFKNDKKVLYEMDDVILENKLLTFNQLCYLNPFYTFDLFHHIVDCLDAEDFDLTKADFIKISVDNFNMIPYFLKKPTHDKNLDKYKSFFEFLNIEIANLFNERLLEVNAKINFDRGMRQSIDDETGETTWEKI
jgi:hypothetical protein